MRFGSLWAWMAIASSTIALQACASQATPDNLDGANDGDDSSPSAEKPDNSETVQASNGSSGSTGGGDTTGTTATSNTFKLTVNVTGGGTVTSSPAGLTCASGMCTGTFTKGISVQIDAAPTAGVLFNGWSGGGCTGTTSCTAVINADTTVTATFQAWDGAWTGTFTNMRSNQGCQFTNNGNITSNFATSGTQFSATAAMDNLELRNIPGCGLVGHTNGSAGQSAMTVSGNKITGTWNLSVQGANGSLDFPYTATIAGRTITGTWTCSGCSGGFTITKQ